MMGEDTFPATIEIPFGPELIALKRDMTDLEFANWVGSMLHVRDIIEPTSVDWDTNRIIIRGRIKISE